MILFNSKKLLHVSDNSSHLQVITILLKEYHIYMRTYKHETHCTKNKRPNQNAQASPPHPTLSEIERSPSQQTTWTIHTKHKTTSPTTQQTQCRQHSRCNQENNDPPIFPHFTLATQDITNLYTNIPVTETWDIISNTIKRNLLNPHTQRTVKL